MLCDYRLDLLFKIAGMFAVMLFAFSGYAYAADTALIDPSGKVSVYRAKKKVDELSAEAPLPYDSLLQCTDQCRVRMNSLYLVASAKSTFHVNAPPQDNLIVFLKGDFYFSLTDLPRQLVFKTPVDDFTVQQVLFQTAASGGRLDGYILVRGETTEIGVLKGGSLIVSSSQGEHMVRAGKQITVARAGTQTGASEGARADGSGVKKRVLIIGGAVGAAVIAGSIALLSGGGSDDPPQASPSSP